MICAGCLGSPEGAVWVSLELRQGALELCDTCLGELHESAQDLKARRNPSRRAAAPVLHRSPNRLPALFGRVLRHPDLAPLWGPGAVNLDAGGGAFAHATDLLAARGVRNLVWDPYARTPAQNAAVLAQLAATPPQTATLSLVLNVIRERRERLALLAWVREWLPRDGVLFITVWRAREAGKRPHGTWQEDRPLGHYQEEVDLLYARSERRGALLIAWNSGS